LWKHVTEPRENGGRTAGWALNISGRITLKELKFGMLTLRAKSRGKLIGRAPVELESVIKNMGRWVDLQGELRDKRKSAGKYTMCIRYRKIDVKDLSDLAM
jgi:hypothetical protein